MNLKEFRIKTKVEFEKEFGCNWRESVSYHFPSSMDYLLGIPLSMIPITDKPKISTLERIKNRENPINKIVCTTKNWIISSDMIKYSSLKPKINKIINL